MRGYDFSSSFAITKMKHIIFHELTHRIANLTPIDTGIYRYVELKKSPNSLININRNQRIEPILTLGMIEFIDEIMAESTACDLAGTYKSEKTQTNLPSLSSDWLTTWNRSYQYLEYEFLQTLLNDNSLNEREVFKSFVIESINNTDIISSYILKVYEKKNSVNCREDLHEISLILGELVNSHNLGDRKIKRVKELMKKYTPVSRMINNLSNSQPSSPIRKLEIYSKKQGSQKK